MLSVFFYFLFFRFFSNFPPLFISGFFSSRSPYLRLIIQSSFYSSTSFHQFILLSCPFLFFPIPVRSSSFSSYSPFLLFLRLITSSFPSFLSLSSLITPAYPSSFNHISFVSVPPRVLIYFLHFLLFLFLFPFFSPLCSCYPLIRYFLHFVSSIFFLSYHVYYRLFSLSSLLFSFRSTLLVLFPFWFCSPTLCDSFIFFSIIHFIFLTFFLSFIFQLLFSSPFSIYILPSSVVPVISHLLSPSSFPLSSSLPLSSHSSFSVSLSPSCSSFTTVVSRFTLLLMLSPRFTPLLPFSYSCPSLPPLFLPSF